MRIKFCNHALLKFRILREHGVKISQKKVKEAIKKPDTVLRVQKGRNIAQRALDEEYVLRVVYEKHNNIIEIITFYPARRQRYEDKL